MTGLMFVMAACMGTGYSMDLKLKQRYFFLRDIRDAMIYLEKEMLFHRTAIREAFTAAAERCQTDAAEVFRRAAAVTDGRSGKRFQEIWNEALETRAVRDLLTEEEQTELHNCGAALCNTDAVMQKVLLEKYIDRLEGFSSRAEEEWREKGRLYRRLALGAGMFLVILLL